MLAEQNHGLLRESVLRSHNSEEAEDKIVKPVSGWGEIKVLYYSEVVVEEQLDPEL